MTYIAPDSTVEFYSEFGLSPNYENTLYFADTATKDAYFSNTLSSKRIATASALSYTRTEREYVRVELPMSTLISAGYMRFKNTQLGQNPVFENKWFYAFVSNIKYINNNCTEVEFELDYMMTWMGSFTLNECYIERQHTTTDGIGEHVADEGLDCGEYVCEGSSTTAFFGSYEVALYKSYNKDKDTFGQYNMSQGTYVPLVRSFYNLNSSGMTALDDYLYGPHGLIEDNRQDELMTMKLCPEHWTDTEDADEPPYDTFSVTKPYSNIGGTNSPYVPRNKKLYTFPYKFLEVENSEGQSIAYKYECFETLPGEISSGDAYFHIMGSACTPEINIMCTPKNYNGEQYSWDESISMTNFPSIAWNIDGYRAYLAQRDSTLFADFIASSITGAASGASRGAAFGVEGAAIGAVGGAITGLLPGAVGVLRDTISDITGPSRFPTTVKGKAESNLMVQSQNKNFYFRRMSVNKKIAEIIDCFFDMYGYAIKKYGTPNMAARPQWTYIKTKGCSISGNLPADHARSIENIFDNGIRFWKYYSNIGKYSTVNNTIVNNG